MATPNKSFLAAAAVLLRAERAAWLQFTAPDGAVLHVAISGKDLIKLSREIAEADKEEDDLPSWPAWQPN